MNPTPPSRAVPIPSSASTPVGDVVTSAQVGETSLVFDARAWNEAGGDVGDNSQFWKPCRVVHIYRKFGNHGDLLATVSWPDGRVSGGHIVSMMRPALAAGGAS